MTEFKTSVEALNDIIEEQSQQIAMQSKKLADLKRQLYLERCQKAKLEEDFENAIWQFQMLTNNQPSRVTWNIRKRTQWMASPLPGIQTNS